MQKLGIWHQRALFSLGTKINGRTDFLFSDRKTIHLHSLKATTFTMKEASVLRSPKIKSSPDENIGGLLEDDDDEVCPVDCVREFKTDDEFLAILAKAKETNALVVVDFYRTSCGSCKYIEQGFTKLCKGSSQEEAPVIFLKHNLMSYSRYSTNTTSNLRLLIASVLGVFHFSISTKMESSWRRFQQGTKNEYSEPFSSTRLQLLDKLSRSHNVFF